VENIAPKPCRQKNLWWLIALYPKNVSGFYVNGTSYHKITDIVIHYKDVSLRWENKKFCQKLTPISFHADFWRNCELRLGTFSWIVSRWQTATFFTRPINIGLLLYRLGPSRNSRCHPLKHYMIGSFNDNESNKPKCLYIVLYWRTVTKYRGIILYQIVV